MFKYHEYLERIINDPATSSTTRAFALDEFKRREDLSNTVGWHIGLPLATAGATAFGQIFLFLNSNLIEPCSECCGSYSGKTSWALVCSSGAAAILWCAAWYLVGWLGGFLFGIPRTLQPDSTASKPAASGVPESNANYRQQVNTNLEQISDWLTKIIVGLGLVQLGNVHVYVRRISNFMAENGCGMRCPPFAAAVVVTFSILGFMTGYLLTRMYLASAFLRADLAGVGTPKDWQERLLGYKFNLASATATGPVPSVDPQTEKAASEATTNSSGVAGSFKDRWARAKALVIQKKYRDAAKDYADLVKDDPKNVELRLEYAWAMFKRSSTWSVEVQEQLSEAYALQPAVGSDDHAGLFASLTFYPLYRLPDGYEDSIKYGDEYTHNPDSLPSAEVWVNLACAYGQKYKTTSDPVENAAIREKALEAVRNAMKIDPNQSQILRWQLLGQDPSENDLSAFANDDDFRQAVLLPRATVASPSGQEARADFQPPKENA